MYYGKPNINCTGSYMYAYLLKRAPDTITDYKYVYM